LNDQRETEVPEGLTNVVAIAAQNEWTIALIEKLPVAEITVNAGTTSIRFHTFLGRNYSVEYSPNLQLGSWLALPGGAVPGNGSDAVVDDPGAGNASTRFYRVKLVQ